MAGTFKIPASGEANETADPLIKTFMETLNGKLNSENDWEDTALASPNNSAYRTLWLGQQVISQETVAGTYPLNSNFGGNAKPIASGANLITASGGTPRIIYFDDTDYTVANKTQKLRIRAQIAANATKPLITFKIGLFPVTVAGGSNELKLTLGAVAGEIVEFIQPEASAVKQGSSGDFTIPADGAYVLGLVTSGTLTANSAALVSAQLQTRSV